MYEGFTDRARKVMALANQEAQRFNHEYIGTEHILLGLIKEGEGKGIKVLEILGVDPRLARREVEKLIKAGSEMVTMGKLPRTPRAMKVIELATEEPTILKDKYVGTQHLLLGLLLEEDGVAGQVLMKLGLKLEQARAQVVNLHYAENQAKSSGALDPAPLVLLLDPGTATAEEIGQLLFEFSTLYRMLGGSGITFTKQDAREAATA